MLSLGFRGKKKPKSERQRLSHLSVTFITRGVRARAFRVASCYCASRDEQTFSHSPKVIRGSMMMDSIASSAEMLFDPFDDDETFPPTGPRGVTPRLFIRWRGTLSYVPTPRRAPGVAGCLPELMAPRLMADATDMTWFALWR